MNAVVSDIHGNLEALEAVLADLDQRGVESVCCLGDFVGYGAAPNQCIELLRPRCELAVAGNHDLAAVGRIHLEYFHDDAAVAARWTDQQLTPEHRQWLLELPFSLHWRGVRVVHASPRQPRAWGYVLSLEDARDEMDAFEEAVCLIGHSHYPGVFVRGARGLNYSRDPLVTIESGSKYLVTVPSVGQPRDGDPRAGYLLIDEPATRLEFVRLEYDVDRAIGRIRDAQLPAFLGERLRWGE
jgi:diadenosine tetraphosphatase ApaH/serine/threonine PP2A family protein phosphatase